MLLLSILIFCIASISANLGEDTIDKKISIKSVLKIIKSLETIFDSKVMKMKKVKFGDYGHGKDKQKVTKFRDYGIEKDQMKMAKFGDYGHGKDKLKDEKRKEQPKKLKEQAEIDKQTAEEMVKLIINTRSKVTALTQKLKNH